MTLLCRLGLHKWYYTDAEHRYCQRCHVTSTLLVRWLGAVHRVPTREIWS